MRTGGRTDKTIIIVSCRNFTKAPKKFYSIYAPKNNTFTRKFVFNLNGLTDITSLETNALYHVCYNKHYRFPFYYNCLNMPRSAAPSSVNLSQKVTTPRPRVNSTNRITQMAFTLCVTCYVTSHELMSIALHVT